MSKEVIIIDYGVGNLRSVYQAISHLGYDCKLSNNKKEIENAYKIILPGVGAFGSAMKKLNKLNLIEPIINFKNKGNYLLGICLGMQIMLTKSYEFGSHLGLNIIEGDVRNFNTLLKSNADIPHIGWRDLQDINKSDNKIFNNIKNNEKFYFIHSYYTNIQKQDNIERIYSLYNDSKFVSMFIRQNIYGMQFHPEKSGKSGIKILYNFLLL